MTPLSRPAVLIIDEINRGNLGNLPKLLGELVYALEYRGHEVRLPFEADGSAKSDRSQELVHHRHDEIRPTALSDTST